MDHDIKTKRPAPVSTIIPLVVVLLTGQYFAPLLQYDRSAIIAGEYWRVLTCHSRVRQSLAAHHPVVRLDTPVR